MKDDLRERCRKAYGDEFVEMYDTLNRGGAIGGFMETAMFLRMLEQVRQEAKEGT